jgi:hypothetical protein
MPTSTPTPENRPTDRSAALPDAAVADALRRALEALAVPTVPGEEMLVFATADAVMVLRRGR